VIGSDLAHYSTSFSTCCQARAHAVRKADIGFIVGCIVRAVPLMFPLSPNQHQWSDETAEVGRRPDDIEPRERKQASYLSTELWTDIHGDPKFS